MQLLALYSKEPRHGKSTLASLLRNHLGFEIVSFATPGRIMLEALAHYTGADWEYMLNEKEEVNPALGFSYRKGMTTLLHEWGRENIDHDIWVHLARTRILRLLEKGKGKVVIDDLRYPNEESMIRLFGGKVFKVERPGFSSGEYSLSHPSENQKVTWDAVIYNGGIPEDMLLDPEIVEFIY